MTKDDLKSLVTEMYENLLENINHQATANTDDVIEYLRNSIHAVTSVSEGKRDCIEETKAAFNNAYQEIANKSISSYQHTSERFEVLTQYHWLFSLPLPYALVYCRIFW